MNSKLETDLVAWSGSALGGFLIEHEMQLLRTRLPQLPGSSLLWLGYPGDHFDARLCMHRERTLVLNDPTAARSTLGDRFGSYLAASVTALPLASASHHAVVVQHAFDQCRDVHEAVRESARVMCLGGQIVVLGFNPYSSWGARRRLSWRWAEAPWGGRLVSLGRMQDWLQLLGFRILETSYSVYRLPLGAPRAPVPSTVRRAGSGLPFGAIYALHARKEGPALNVIRPTRQTLRPRLVPATVTGRIAGAVPQQRTVLRAVTRQLSSIDGSAPTW